MNPQAEELRRRLALFALAVVRLVRRLPREVATDHIVRQVARSAGGMASNYRAACCARSMEEFVAKLGEAADDADEASGWLWMADQIRLAPGTDFQWLVRESKELTSILSSSLSTARRNLRQAEAAERPDRKQHRAAHHDESG
jgi:four helix bundle protein